MGDESGRPDRITWSALNLFASEHFVITTYLDDAEIHRRLEEVITPYSILTMFFKILFNPRPYLGRISTDGFKAERTMYDVGAPMVIGRFWNDGQHTLIDVTIKHQISTILRTYGVMAALVIFLMTSGLDFQFLAPWLVLVVVMSAFTILLTIPKLTREVGRSKQFFRELLEDIGEG